MAFDPCDPEECVPPGIDDRLFYYMALVRLGALVSQGSAEAFVETTPTIANAASVTIAAADPDRKYLMVQNNSGANIMISLSGAVLTGIIPTSTNIGIVLASGAKWESTGVAPTSVITAYQTSGAPINTVSVVQG